MRSSMRSENDLTALFSGRASALLAALMTMVMLLLAAAMPGELRELLSQVASARSASASTAEEVPMEAAQSEAPAPSVTVRLAEVDKDVSPEDAARLAVITAEVLDKNVGSLKNAEGPTVLVYHTHDTEAYTQTEANPYEPSASWRTEDAEKSVIAVGEELCRILNEQYGICALHATERHELPLITTAYSRSLQTIEKYRALYPSLMMFIDLHRDGVPDTGYEDDYALIDGVQVARMMFVVGTGRGASGKADDPVPDFESNYALALGLTEKLLSFNSDLARKVRVKAGKYNQQVSDKSVLVEVGHNANTLEQALAAMPYLAAAIAETAGIPPALTESSFAP